MFLYWPWLALMAVLVLISAVVVLKVGGQVCRARITTLPPKQMTSFQPEADIELAMSQGGWDHQEQYGDQDHHDDDYNDLQYGQDEMEQIDYTRREVSL